MAYPGHYRKGDHRCTCDVCGQTFYASQMKMRWDGLFCCKEDWEVRQPQDFVRGIPDDPRADPARPPPAFEFTNPSVFGGYLLAITSNDTPFLTQQDGGRLVIQVENG